MNLYKSIGGYFELELNNSGTVWHDKAVALNSGRNAFEFILMNNSFSKVYVPYYTCDVILQPLKRQNIIFEFYFLKEDLTPDLQEIGDSEAIIYVNYFGVMTDSIKSLIQKFKNIIIDNSQAFFDYPIKNTPTFYSPRKFFGVPDGGFAYSYKIEHDEFEKDHSEERVSHLIKRIDENAEAGYELFKKNDTMLDNLEVRSMSQLTKQILRNIDFERVKEKRNQNFRILHNVFSDSNKLTEIIEQNSFHVPMVYPFFKKGNCDLRKKLINNKVYVATYWPNVSQWMKNKTCFEIFLKNNLIPLPIDQRYNEKDMNFIIDIINS